MTTEAGLRSVVLTLFSFLSVYRDVLELREATLFIRRKAAIIFLKKEVLKIICSLIYLIVTEMSNSTRSSLFFILHLEDRRILCDIHRSKTKEGRDIISGD